MKIDYSYFKNNRSICLVCDRKNSISSLYREDKLNICYAQCSDSHYHCTVELNYDIALVEKELFFFEGLMIEYLYDKRLVHIVEYGNDLTFTLSKEHLKDNCLISKEILLNLVQKYNLLKNLA